MSRFSNDYLAGAFDLTGRIYPGRVRVGASKRALDEFIGMMNAGHRETLTRATFDGREDRVRLLRWWQKHTRTRDDEIARALDDLASGG